MGLSLWHLVEAAVLFTNALAILNEKRLLAHWGLDRPTQDDGGLKFQVTIALYALRNYIRPILVLCNTAVILVEGVFG